MVTDAPILEEPEILAWDVVASDTRGSTSVLVHDADGAMVVSRQTGASTFLLTERRSEGERVLELTSAAVPQDAFRTHSGTVFSTTSFDHEGVADVRWWEDGAVEASVLWSLRQGDGGGSIAVVGSTLYLTESTEERSCLREMDLSANDPASTLKDTVCSAGNRFGLWWLETDGSTLSWLVHDAESAEDCSALVRMVDGAPEPVRGAECISRGEATADFAVWAENPPVDEYGSVDYFRTDISVLHDGTVTGLGSGAAGSAVLCGDWVLWKAQGDDSSMLRAWRPGRAVGVLELPGSRELTEDGYLVSAPNCVGDDAVGVHRTLGPLDGGTEYLTAPLPH